jgi:hypothetical protein
MSEPLRDPRLAGVEAALAGLKPVPGGLSRDALLFRAGQASVRRGWAWPAATALLAVAVLGLTMALVVRPTPEPERIFVQVPVEVERAPAPPVAEPQTPPAPPPVAAAPEVRVQPVADNYLRLRQQVLRHGVDSLPNLPPAEAAARPTPIHELLGLPPGSGQDPWLLHRQPLTPSGDAS